MKEVDIEAEKKILRELHVKMLLDHTTDVDEEMKYIAEDAWVIPPNSPLVEGAEALRELCNEMVGTKVLDMGVPGRGIMRLEISASGDLAYDIGRFRIVNQGPEGPIEEKGYFVTLYKKIDGQWKFAGQIWNNINST